MLRIYSIHILGSTSTDLQVDKKEIIAYMKNIYNAPNKEITATELDNQEKEMGRKDILMLYFLGETTGMT